MNEAPTDHCCAAVAAHTRNFWSTRTHNSNCQQIKTGGEKALQMFPGNRNISKWLKLQCWGNSSASGLFAWNSDFDVYVQTSRGIYEPWKHTKHFFNTIKQILSLRGVIYFILCPELNLLQKKMVTSVVPNLRLIWITRRLTGKQQKKRIIYLHWTQMLTEFFTLPSSCGCFLFFTSTRLLKRISYLTIIVEIQFYLLENLIWNLTSYSWILC